jgi:glycosyltransferase involved in cell wall biosynthesis
MILDKTKPLVSIVMPVYNGAKYLRQAIDSALDQTYDNIEVIVVNDGSNDNGKTEEIARSYGNRIKYLYKENGGVATALNVAIKSSKGEYISWLSHDDLYYKNKIERQMKILDSISSSRVLLYTDYNAIDANGDVIQTVRLESSKTRSYEDGIISSLFKSSIHGCSLLIPKKCFSDVGYFDEHLKTTQDYDLWFKLFVNGYEFRHVPEVLICTRWHEEQGTHALSTIHHKEVEELYIWAFDMLYENIKKVHPETIVELILFLRARTLVKSPDYILSKIKRSNPGLYLKTLRYNVRPLINNFLQTVDIKAFVKKQIVRLRALLESILPQFVKDIINIILDRCLYFIKIDKKTAGRKRILFVALPESLHTARWINQFKDKGWDLYLFPAVDSGKVHPDTKNVTIYYSAYGAIGRQKDSENRYRGLYIPSRYGPKLASYVRTILRAVYPAYRYIQLKRLIRRLQPDLVHSIEFQNSGYLTFYVKESYHGKFPKWLVTNYGNDIFLFGRLKSHKDIIRRILKSCDYYSCECYRDVDLAREYGFKGEVLPVFPNTGGYDLELASELKVKGPVSERRLIMIKGYGLERGRALVAMRAIERCADLIKENGYRIIIYLATYDVIFAAELLEESTGIPIQVYPMNMAVDSHHYAFTHEEMLRLHGQARISINNNISDGIAISLLDAMVMGSFPIHSSGACGNEWFEDGISGIIVPANDPDVIERAIRTALTDDELVNNAAVINWRTSVERLDQNKLKKESLEFYNKVFEE